MGSHLIQSMMLAHDSHYCWRSRSQTLNWK